MSYCVNCGVELEESLSACPLCNTPVYHPEKEKMKEEKPLPYPEKKGEVGLVRRTDLAILISVLLGCTAVGCGALNLLVYHYGHWSFYVIGACGILWIFFAPTMLYHRLPLGVSLTLDAVAVSLYCAMIAWSKDGWGWYVQIALPLVLLAGILVYLVILLNRHVSRSILFTAMTVVMGLTIYCGATDLCIRMFLTGAPGIGWSSVVLVCGLIISVTLVTIMRVDRLREEVRRRMHL